MPIKSNEIETANRAEATAILIRAGYRVYRPEADVHGEDLVIRSPEGALRSVQMKGRPAVEWKRYGGKTIWMLFPDPQGPQPGRPWFLVEHDEFFQWVKARHGTAQGMDGCVELSANERRSSPVVRAVQVTARTDTRERHGVVSKRAFAEQLDA